MAASSVDGEPPMSKRRKIRKGTNSCWECKRRKIRCTFANPTESICDGCRSRGVSCVSQAYQNNAEAVTNNSARLNRIEAAIAQLERRACTDTVLQNDTQDAASKTKASDSSYKSSMYPLLTRPSEHLGERRSNHPCVEGLYTSRYPPRCMFEWQN